MNNLNNNIIKNNPKAKIKKIAVIGAGYTGLTVAYRLSKKGYQVTIFEKEDFIGGLTSGFNLDGVPLEKIWHFLYLSDKYALDLAKELEVKNKLIFHNSTVSTYYDGKLYPFMSPKDLLFFSPISILSRIRTGLVGVYLKLLRNWHPLTKITAYNWMNKWAGREATRVIWKPLLEGKFGKYYDKVIMSWLWGRIKVRVDSQEDKGEQLGYFRGGFGILTDGLKNNIVKNGGQIKLSNEVRTIVSKAEKVVIQTEEGEEVFDKVVATTPSPVFANLIEKNEKIKQSYLDKLRSVDYVGAIVMAFSSSQKISPYYWHNVNDEKIPFLVFLANSELAGTETYQGKHIYYIGFYAEHDHHYFKEDKNEIMAEWLKGVKKMFPDFSEEKITDKNLFKFKNAQHIVDLNYKSRIPAYQTPMDNVLLSNFSQIYPEDRGLNFAIRDGEKIARMIMDDK
jgi:protoporphyrinogen oxidase